MQISLITTAFSLSVCGKRIREAMQIASHLAFRLRLRLRLRRRRRLDICIQNQCVVDFCLRLPTKERAIGPGRDRGRGEGDGLLAANGKQTRKRDA